MRKISFVVLLLVFSLSAYAAITGVFAYGDSLSDNGNLYAAAGKPTSPPYFNGRFSNGPVAVELLAQKLGVPLTDFAWGGATTGLGAYGDPGGSPVAIGMYGLPGMTTQYNLTLPLVIPTASSSLFVIWGGPDDFLAPAPGDSAMQTADRAVADLLAIVFGLQSHGAQHILVAGMPDLGLTPSFIKIGEGATGSMLTDYFNANLKAGLPPGVMFVDTAATMRAMYANPAAFGLTNVTTACLQGGVACATPDSYLFWDDFHPTAEVHSMVADAFFAAAVPEPATVLLVMVPMIGFAIRRAFRSRSN